MTDSEIKATIRRGVMEPKAVKIGAAKLTEVVAEAVNQLGMMLKKYSIDSLKTRKTIASTTHVFDYPSDCDVLGDVWDIDTNAGTITGATNATPIVITEDEHGRSTDEIHTIHDVGGNLVANNTWKITKVGASSYSLNGSVATDNYTSGGKVFEETTDFLEMTRIPESKSTLDDDSKYYIRNGKIVVDDIDFTNDLLITYIHSVAGITDISTKYHLGVVAFGVIYLIDMPDPEAKNYGSKRKNLDFYIKIWEEIIEDIKHGSQITTKALGISKGKWI